MACIDNFSTGRQGLGARRQARQQRTCMFYSRGYHLFVIYFSGSKRLQDKSEGS